MFKQRHLINANRHSKDSYDVQVLKQETYAFYYYFFILGSKFRIAIFHLS